MEKKFDVIALGELLIDFTENGVSAQGNPIFEANPGGAPCNVLAMLNNLGKKTSFLGVVGKDQFGTSLRKTLNELICTKIRKFTQLWLLYIHLKTVTEILHFIVIQEQT